GGRGAADADEGQLHRAWEKARAERRRLPPPEPPRHFARDDDEDVAARRIAGGEPAAGENRHLPHAAIARRDEAALRLDFAAAPRRIRGEDDRSAGAAGGERQAGTD